VNERQRVAAVALHQPLQASGNEPREIIFGREGPKNCFGCGTDGRAGRGRLDLARDVLNVRHDDGLQAHSSTADGRVFCFAHPRHEMATAVIQDIGPDPLGV